MIQHFISKNEEIRFIYMNYTYITNHFDFWFEKIEGSACSHDKTKTVIRKIINFYLYNEIINFDYNQEYTYHLPKKIFKGHDSIVNFYQSIKHLYYGKPNKYMTELLNIKNEI